MGLHYENLDSETRAHMLSELELDIKTNNLLESTWLSEQGKADWPELMRVAIKVGADDTLADELRSDNRMNQTGQRRKPKGGFTTYRLPDRAPNVIAEGEFNRYYVRGVCLRALEAQGENAEIGIYRGKEVENPRVGSEEKIGQNFSAQAILDDLRASVGLEPTLGMPPGPNSGLTAKLL
jgi:hypothetical protein